MRTFLTLPVPCARKHLYFLIFLFFTSGFAARWVDHRGTRGIGGYRRRRYGRLGEGSVFLRLFLSAITFRNRTWEGREDLDSFQNSIQKQSVFSVVYLQARNKVGQVGYVPEKYLQFPTSSSLLSMLQSLAALDSRSHTSNNSTEADLVSGSLNGDSSGKYQLKKNK